MRLAYVLASRVLLTRLHCCGYRFRQRCSGGDEERTQPRLLRIQQRWLHPRKSASRTAMDMRTAR